MDFTQLHHLQRMYVIMYIKNLPWFGVGYDFYTTSCVFSIPSLGEEIKTLKELDKNHIQFQTMGDSFYHIFKGCFTIFSISNFLSDLLS